ncbi:27928_t:CDS:2, partial [Gigaspora margarita]
MANESNKNIFDSIFSETHCELESLNNEISQLQDVYLTDYNSDKESDNEASEFIIDETSDETSDKASESIAKWEALRTYYQNFGLTSKTHALTGHVSNFAISFLTTLNILHFIANFANQHGLPSP